VKYVTDVFSIIDRGVRSKDHSPGVVAPEKYLDRYLIELAEQDTDQMKAIASPGYHLTRMSVFMTVSSTAAVMALAEEIHEKVADLLPQGWDYFIAGQTYLLARMSQNLVVDEVKSILIAMGSHLFVVDHLDEVFEDWADEFIRKYDSNGFCFGMMPLLSIQLNTATAMIGAVAVGLIVDNSIHVLFRFRESEKKSAVNEKMVKHVMNYCAQPLISAGSCFG
jgi:predicted RND superfamily exporter protein